MDYAVTRGEEEEEENGDGGVVRRRQESTTTAAEHVREKEYDDDESSKIGLLQAAATGARNVGTLLSLLVGLFLYVRSLHSREARDSQG